MLYVAHDEQAQARLYLTLDPFRFWMLAEHEDERRWWIHTVESDWVPIPKDCEMATTLDHNAEKLDSPIIKIPGQ